MKRKSKIESKNKSEDDKIKKTNQYKEMIYNIKILQFPELADVLFGNGIISVEMIDEKSFSIELKFEITQQEFSKIEKIERFSEIITDKVLKKIQLAETSDIRLKFQPTLSCIDKIKESLLDLSKVEQELFTFVQNWILTDVEILNQQ